MPPEEDLVFGGVRSQVTKQLEKRIVGMLWEDPFADSFEVKPAVMVSHMHLSTGVHAAQRTKLLRGTHPYP